MMMMMMHMFEKAAHQEYKREREGKQKYLLIYVTCHVCMNVCMYV